MNQGGLWVGSSMGNEVVVAAMEHDTRVVPNEGKGVTMQVSEHRVAAPATDYADGVRVNATEEKGHGPTGTEGPSCNIGRVDACMAWDGQGSTAEETCNHRTADAAA